MGLCLECHTYVGDKPTVAGMTLIKYFNHVIIHCAENIVNNLRLSLLIGLFIFLKDK